MPDKRRLATSKVCFGSEKAGLLDHSYNKCALVKSSNLIVHSRLLVQTEMFKAGPEYLLFLLSIVIILSPSRTKWKSSHIPS